MFNRCVKWGLVVKGRQRSLWVAPGENQLVSLDRRNLPIIKKSSDMLLQTLGHRKMEENAIINAVDLLVL